MNYLELCQRVRLEAGVSGTGPASVTGQTGEMARIVSWVATSYDDIQRSRLWDWLRASFTFTTTPNDHDYSYTDAGIASRFASWDVQSFRIYKNSVGVNDEIELPFVRYPDYRSVYLTGPQVAGRPAEFSVSPDHKLLLGPLPDDAYVVTGEYVKAPQTLSADADIPEMPEQFHMMIVYRALMKYARFEAAGEIYQDAEREYLALKRQLEYNQMPMIEWADPLA